MSTKTEVKKSRDYSTEELDDIVNAELDELVIDGRRLRKTMDAVPFGNAG